MMRRFGAILAVTFLAAIPARAEDVPASFLTSPASSFGVGPVVGGTGLIGGRARINLGSRVSLGAAFLYRPVLLSCDRDGDNTFVQGTNFLLPVEIAESEGGASIVGSNVMIPLDAVFWVQDHDSSSDGLSRSGILLSAGRSWGDYSEAMFGAGWEHETYRKDRATFAFNIGLVYLAFTSDGERDARSDLAAELPDDVAPEDIAFFDLPITLLWALSWRW